MIVEKRSWKDEKKVLEETISSYKTIESTLQQENRYLHCQLSKLQLHYHKVDIGQIQIEQTLFEKKKANLANNLEEKNSEIALIKKSGRRKVFFKSGSQQAKQESENEIIGRRQKLKISHQIVNVLRLKCQSLRKRTASFKRHCK